MKKLLLTVTAILVLSLSANAAFTPQSISAMATPPCVAAPSVQQPVVQEPTISAPYVITSGKASSGTFTVVPARGAVSYRSNGYRQPAMSVQGQIISERQIFTPAGGGMPVLSSAGITNTRKAGSSTPTAEYSAVSFTKFTIPFAAAKVRDGKTTNETYISDDMPVRQNAVILPGDPDPGQIAPLNGAWIVMMVLAIAYVVGQNVGTWHATSAEVEK